ncbi:phosphatase domain-containing protein [Nocardiopsis flavescens]
MIRMPRHPRHPSPENKDDMADRRQCILVDIDGTLALREGEHARGPFEWHRVGEDSPNTNVIEVVRRLAAGGLDVVYMSGRSDECRRETLAWLDGHVGVAGDLHMRRRGDFRSDDTVKRELYRRHVRDRADVLCVLDDRDKVVRMWRELGLTVLQVAEGDF